MQGSVFDENMPGKWLRRENGKNKWWNGKHNFRMVLSALMSAYSIFQIAIRRRGWTVCPKNMKLKQKWYIHEQTTAKNAIFIELQLENCYLVRGV